MLTTGNTGEKKTFDKEMLYLKYGKNTICIKLISHYQITKTFLLVPKVVKTISLRHNCAIIAKLKGTTSKRMNSE